MEPGQRSITAENLPQIRQQIGIMRDQKGREEETLALINDALKVARQNSFHSDVVNLLLEACLVWQHRYMAIRDGAREGSASEKETAAEQMGLMAAEADQYVKEHNLSHLQYRPLLFLGKAALAEKNYEQAKDFFIQAHEVLPDSEEYQANKANEFELLGKIAATDMYLGNVTEGMRTAKETYDKFDTTEAGQQLRASDEYVWKVWKTGVAIGSLMAAVTIGADIDREVAAAWLDDVEQQLDDPEKFQIRRDEINAIKTKLA